MSIGVTRSMSSRSSVNATICRFRSATAVILTVALLASTSCAAPEVDPARRLSESMIVALRMRSRKHYRWHRFTTVARVGGPVRKSPTSPYALPYQVSLLALIWSPDSTLTCRGVPQVTLSLAPGSVGCNKMLPKVPLTPQKQRGLSADLPAVPKELGSWLRLFMFFEKPWR